MQFCKIGNICNVEINEENYGNPHPSYDGKLEGEHFYTSVIVANNTHSGTMLKQTWYITHYNSNITPLVWFLFVFILLKYDIHKKVIPSMAVSWFVSGSVKSFMHSFDIFANIFLNGIQTFLWPLLLTWFNFNPSMDK